MLTVFFRVPAPSGAFMRFARRMRATAAAILAVTLLLSSTARASGFFEFTVADEKKLGEKFNALVQARLPMVEDAEIKGYVRELVDRVAKNMNAQPFPLTVSVVKDNSMNAFAAPAGYVYVFTGLILNLSHESELAAVIAHELAHVSQRHIASKVESMKYLSIAQVLGMLAGAALGMAANNPEMGGAMVLGSQAAAAQTFLKYSREDERAADDVGMNYLTAAGYNPRGMTGAFTTMRRMKYLKGLGDVPAYLSTHPGIPERIAYLEDRIKNMPVDLTGRANDNAKFLRVQTLIRARYTDPSLALAYYSKLGDKASCLDKLGKAIALSRTQNIALAAKPFDAALACSGNDALFQREAGRYFMKIRQYAKAKTLLRRAYEQNPADLEAEREYALLLAQEGDHARALQLMSAVMLRQDNNPETHAEYGRMLGESGDLFGAHLHLAYAAIYRSDEDQAEFQVDKAKALAASEEQRNQFSRLEKLYEKRKEFWRKGLGL